MPSIQRNIDTWAKSYDWSGSGEEWSQVWGGTPFMWNITILPRIQPFLPVLPKNDMAGIVEKNRPGRSMKTILEIAPGFGRCTHYLLDHCESIVVVDLSDRCIDGCKRRFSGRKNIEYFVNDGKSLDMVPDGSIDFIFSWDSLVHADREVLKAYVSQFPRIMKPGGYGFIHHSNIGSYVNKETGRVMCDNRHWRDETMTAALFEEFCREAGIKCLSQEKVNWGADVLNDCFSLFTYKNPSALRNNRVVDNRDYWAEIKHSYIISLLYNPANFYNK